MSEREFLWLCSLIDLYCLTVDHDFDETMELIEEEMQRVDSTEVL